jgi:acetyltransferase-like isoleucine patch superfamily enzyme
LSTPDPIQSHIAPLENNDPRITVGRFTYGKPHFAIWSENETISIGAFCSIADGVKIFGGGEHKSDWLTTFPLRIALNLEGAHLDGHPASKGPTRIGHDVWLGADCKILSGVTIGNGAIIGAGAVVANDVEPYAIYVGNPARKVRSRHPPETIALLQSIAWWDWDISIIRQAVSFLCARDINALQGFAIRHGLQTDKNPPSL